MAQHGKMKVHELKIWRNYADDKVSGAKMFEVRDNSDRQFQKGDRVVYTVVDPKRNNATCEHELSKRIFEIIYVFTSPNLAPNYVIFAEREIFTDGGKADGKEVRR